MKSIDETKNWFKQFFSDRREYSSQTNDDKQLNDIIEELKIDDTIKSLLDIGTGTGYLALNIAHRYPSVKIVGLDIVEEVLEDNRRIASKDNLSNVEFTYYDGNRYPFEDDSYDRIVTRYALHHFPDIELSFSEMARVIKRGGLLLLSDPIPNDSDTVRFVDEYMKLKHDGHICFYAEDELVRFAKNAGFVHVGRFISTITFPRSNDYGDAYEALLKKYDEEYYSDYNLTETDNGENIEITLRVLNSVFCKT